ncbi:MAG: 2TM domain-containing protein [Bacteroidota bacterium]
MEKELRKLAEEKVEAKHGFYIISTVFAAISVILYVVSLNVGGGAAFWIKFPIMILALILGVVYVSLFGWSVNRPFDGSWKEEEIQREMARISLEQQSRNAPRREAEKEWEEVDAFHYQEWAS